MKVAVIGAGAMGSGIAQSFAQCAEVEKVYLCDIKEEFAQGGFNKIKGGLEKQVAKGKMEQAAADAILAKFVCGLNTIAVDPDLVVEAALEVMDIKKKAFKELQDEIVKNPDCIFASNTSSLSITEIGAGLAKPIIGMHFFNPAPVMKLVEVIAGINTPQEYVDKINEISVKLGKVPVQVNEAAGFVVNRILIPMINEAINVKYTGVSDIAGIDTAMKLGCNHPMGPLELGDFIGLDICLAIMDVIYADTGDNKYAASPLLRKMVRGKRLGVKTGIGFYDYSNGPKNKVATDK
jgi:3-hydroxybutyryl-CoA dehydrogenase